MAYSEQDSRSKGVWQGMNWIRQEKRLAIYLRDGMACAYCGISVEDGAKLSLDHIQPHSQGGSNHVSNLVTCCSRCNSSRGDRDLEVFASAVAAYINHDTTAEQIVAHVRDCASRDLKQFKQEASLLVQRRGSAKRALEDYS